MKQRPVHSDQPLELPVEDTSTQLTREFLTQQLGQKKAVVDALLGVEVDEG